MLLHLLTAQSNQHEGLCDVFQCATQDCLALGVIFAATDSVAVLQVLKQDRSPLLYSLVFGEGVINDATAVALLRAVQVGSITHIEGPAKICPNLSPARSSTDTSLALYCQVHFLLVACCWCLHQWRCRRDWLANCWHEVRVTSQP